MTHGSINSDDTDYLLALGVEPPRTDLFGSAAVTHREKQIKTAAIALADLHGSLLKMGFDWLEDDYMKGDDDGWKDHDG